MAPLLFWFMKTLWSAVRFKAPCKQSKGESGDKKFSCSAFSRPIGVGANLMDFFPKGHKILKGKRFIVWVA